jgi:Gpi18-like mannosyltransferase
MVVGPLIYFHFKHKFFVVIRAQLMVAFGFINFIFKNLKLLSIGATTTNQR